MTDRERIKELRDTLREAEILVGILKRHLKNAESLANMPVDVPSPYDLSGVKRYVDGRERK